MAFPSAAAVSDKPVDDNCRPHATKTRSDAYNLRRLITPCVRLFHTAAPRANSGTRQAAKQEPHMAHRFLARKTTTTRRLGIVPRDEERRETTKIYVKDKFVFLLKTEGNEDNVSSNVDVATD